MAAKKPRATSSRTTSEAPQGPRDYIAIAKAYAHEAIADRKGKRFGKWIRLGAKRFLDDLKRAGPRGPYRFDGDEARNACDFIEKLPHVEGVWDTQTIVLHPSHVWFVVQLFGFRNHDGTRRFTSALFAVARKNAKSTLAAAILLYVLCCEDEPGAQVLSAATTYDQASIVWKVAKRMVEKTSDLREAFLLEPFAKAIARYENGGTFKPIHAKASTQDGLNPSAVCLDEVHAHKDHDLLNVLKSAAGARRSPLFLYTTTEGYETPGPWPEIRTFAHHVLNGVLQADHFLFVLYAVDKDDKDFDAASWHKANPLMDVNPLLGKEITKEAIEAKGMPGKLAEFRIKRLNRAASVANGWTDLGRWSKCAGAVDLEALAGRKCWVGLDLASTRDLTVLRIVWREDGKWLTYGRGYVPKASVQTRAERGTVDYAAWVAAGRLVETEGDVTDYAVIEADINNLRELFDVRAIAFDPWNAQDLSNRLTEAGAPMIKFIQGAKSYHPAMQEVERAYVGGTMVHDGDPVLTWCAANLVARKDVNGNTAPDRQRSSDKIDHMAALFMAIGVALTEVEPDSVYESRGMVTLG